MTDQPVALVTAASRGIGAACARELAQRGFALALMARSASLRAVADELGALAVCGSVTNTADLRSLVDGAMAVYGRIDGVVNNTGHPANGPLLELSDDDWHQGLDLVLLNVVRMARLVVPIMVRQGGGALVNISSFGAAEPHIAFPVSSSLRGALSGFTKLFADSHAAAGIRMNNVLPGYVDTYPVSDATRGMIPMGRPATAGEIATATAFLLSEEAAYVTGQSIRVDGGLTRSL